MSDTTTTTSRTATTTRRPTAMAIVRAVVALAGVAALTVGALLDWIDGVAGDRLAFEAYWDASPGTADTFLDSAAIGMLGVAVLGVIGLAFLGGWVLRIAGAIGLAGVLLIFAQMGRADLAIADATEAGLWLCMGGAALLMVAGFVAVTRTVTEVAPAEQAPAPAATAETVVSLPEVPEPVSAEPRQSSDLGFGRPETTD